MNLSHRIVRTLALMGALVLLTAGCVFGGDSDEEGSGDDTGQISLQGDEDKAEKAPDDDGDSTEVLPATLAAVGQKTAEVTSGRYTLSIELTGDVPPDVAEQVGPMTAEIEFSGDDMAFSMDLSAMAEFDEEAAAMFGDDFSMEMVATEDAVYMKGFFAALFGGGADGWIGLPADSEEELAGTDTESMSADNWFRMLEGVSEADVEVVGEEEVNGVSTTHHRATATLEQLAAADPEAAADFDLEGLEASDVEMNVWVDDDGFARRVSFDIQYEGGDIEIDGMGMSVTIDMFDLNEDITIEVPEGVTIMTEEEMMASLFGGAFGELGEAFGEGFGDTEGLEDFESQMEDLADQLEGDLGGLTDDLGLDLEDGPQGYGDDAELDALYDSCAGGDGQACDDLYYQSPFGSEYEDFGNTCGGRGFEVSCA
jgi:hypothetical protein